MCLAVSQITNHRDVTRLCVAVTLVAVGTVTLLMTALYPRDEWLREIMIDWPTTTLVAYGTTLFVGQKLLKIHALNRELQRLVSRDRLTNVSTRDFFFAKLATQPESYGVSLMIDIDHFKRVNDAFGHLCGDKVIAHVARLLAGEAGARDIVCRFGGEEFVVFLENANQTIAREVAERIRQRVADTPVDCEGNRVSVTISIGGSLRLAAADIEDGIQQADTALYQAKAQGRNRTVMTGDLFGSDPGPDVSRKRPAA